MSFARRALPHLVVVAIVVGIVALLARADRLPAGDATHLAATTLALADDLRAGRLPGFFAAWLGQVAPQPPAGFAPGIAAATLLGGRWLAFLVPGGLALALIWDALRRIDPDAAWAPMLVVVASAMVWLAVAQYGWDLLCAAAVLQALSWLHRADAFADRRATLLFGLWVGVGVLTKYTFPFFVWLPSLWAARRLGDPARRANLARAVGVAALVVAPWLVLNAPAFAAYLGRSLGPGAEAAVEVSRAGAGRFSLASLSLYPLALKDAVGWPGLVVLLGAGIAGARHVPAVGALAALGGLAVLSVLEQSQDRYALPALVAGATLALAVPRLRWGLEVFVGVFVVLLGGSVATFRPGAAAAAAPRFDHGPDSAAVLSWPRSRSYRPTAVDLEAWQVDAALAELRDAHGADEGVVGLLLPDDPTLPEPGVWMLRARLAGHRWDLRVVRPRGAEPPRGGWPGDEVRTLLAVWRPDRDTAADAWIGATERVSTRDLPGGVIAGVLRR